MNNNYVAIVPMTHQEKVKMYRAIKKDKLIEMLIAANEALEARPQQVIMGGEIRSFPKAGDPVNCTTQTCSAPLSNVIFGSY